MIKSKKDSQKQFTEMMDFLTAAAPSNWTDITEILQQIKNKAQTIPTISKSEFVKLAASGTAFYTFDYGIDGVSIEIVKYARALEALFHGQGRYAIHLIGERFYSQADSIVSPEWFRYQIEGINGWAKWDQGKWFEKLFYEDMPEDSETSNTLANEIYSQAIIVAWSLCEYLAKNHINLLIPVNVASNPGNMASTLALTLVSEMMGARVINSNHDFYWEGGKPKSERDPGERSGSRDYFFRNYENRPFFSLFQSLYPWDSDRWIQVNINKQQTKRLVKDYGFSKHKVFEISTSVSDSFFTDYTVADTKLAQLRMTYILSDGEVPMYTISVDERIAGLKSWMSHQTPCILGHRASLCVDPRTDELIYLLQPTRIIPRKRIERDLELIAALLAEDSFREYFHQDPRKKIVLHITGPTPIEHRAYLKRLLQKFSFLGKSLPPSIADRIFLAFSVGHEDHPSLRDQNYSPLNMEEIYRMATVVLFPSSREGRGLPIIESCASGVPIICRRYSPVEVFDEVIGERLPEDQKIFYTPFPKKDNDPALIKEISHLLINPQSARNRNQHNKEVVRLRYSREALTKSFERYFEYFCTPAKTIS